MESGYANYCKGPAGSTILSNLLEEARNTGYDKSNLIENSRAESSCNR